MTFKIICFRVTSDPAFIELILCILNGFIFLKPKNLFRPGKFSIRGDQVNYSGCMKEVVIEGKPVEMTADRLIGDIHSHVCPTI